MLTHTTDAMDTMAESIIIESIIIVARCKQPPFYYTRGFRKY